jgi:hypothetical protein
MKQKHKDHLQFFALMVAAGFFIALIMDVLG